MGKTLVARITVKDDDETASDDAAQKLRVELQDIDEILHVEQAARGGAPDGARGDLIAIGTLIVTLAAQLEVLATLVGYVVEWRRQRRRGEVRVQIGDRVLIIPHATDAQIDQIIKAWIEEGPDPDA